MKHLGTRTALVITGALLAAIGSWMMAQPRIFLAMSEVIVEPDPGLMSEVTASSGLLIIVGAFMIISAIKVRLASLGLVAGAVVYGSYGFSRLVSQDLHGTPSYSLVVAMYFELAIAVMLLALNFKIQAANPPQWKPPFHQEMTQ